MRAGVYRRISSDDEHDRLGVERQTPPCMKLAEAKGAEVVKVFTDNDISASKGKRRREYEEMLQWVRDGQLDILIAYAAARFTRNPRESLDLLDLADEYGIQLATVTGQYDLATSEGRYRWRDAANRAAQEAEEIAERVRLKHAELRANGRFHGGQRAFGHITAPVIVGNKVRYRVELHEEEAEQIRAAGRRIRRGGSISAITREWNAPGGIRRPRGRLWDTPRVRELLTSPRIAGLRENGGELVEADWPRIVRRDEWEQLRAILADKPTQKGPKEPRSYLGSGTYLCDLCGTPMLGQARLRVPAYACRRERGGCGRLHRMAKPLDDYLRDEVLDALASAKFRAKLEAIYGADDDLAAELVARRDGALARLKQLRDLAGDPTVEFDVDDFAAAKRSLDRVIDEATAKLAELPASNALADLPDTAELLHALWERAPLDRRRALVRLAVDVVIVKAPGGGKRFQPSAFPPGEERDKHVAEHVEIIWKV